MKRARVLLLASAFRLLAWPEPRALRLLLFHPSPAIRGTPAFLIGHRRLKKFEAELRILHDDPSEMESFLSARAMLDIGRTVSECADLAFGAVCGPCVCRHGCNSLVAVSCDHARLTYAGLGHVTLCNGLRWTFFGERTALPILVRLPWMVRPKAETCWNGLWKDLYLRACRRGWNIRPERRSEKYYPRSRQVSEAPISDKWL